MTGSGRKPDPAKAAREARRAEALRANLQRRKAQARGRAHGRIEPSLQPDSAANKPDPSARDR